MWKQEACNLLHRHVYRNMFMSAVNLGILTQVCGDLLTFRVSPTFYTFISKTWMLISIWTTNNVNVKSRETEVCMLMLLIAEHYRRTDQTDQMG